MRGRAFGWSVVLILAAVRPAVAQGAGDVGLTFAYPGSVGLTWQITNGIAVRPDFSVARTEAESTSTSTVSFPGAPVFSSSSTSTSKGWGSTTGLSLLFTVRTIDQVRVYVAPRLAYLHAKSDTTTDVGPSFGGITPAIAATESKTTGWLGAGSVGTEFRAHDRFAIFGELGVQYLSQTSKSTFSTSRNRSEVTQVGLRSAVGATLYF